MEDSSGSIPVRKRAAAFARAMLAVFAVFAALLGTLGNVHAQTSSRNVLSESPAADPAEAPRRVVIRFLTEGDFPPFNYIDDEGVLSGFNIDLARAVCSEAGAACDIKVRPWDELLLALRRGEADAVIASHAVTPEALAQVDFTDRYFHTPARFAAQSSAPAGDVSPEDLYGRSIAVARGGPHEAYLKAFFRESRIVPYETAELAREALLQGKADFVFDDGISLAFWLNGTLSRRCCEFRGGAFLEPRYFGDGLAVAVPRTDAQIRLIINQALQKIRASGRFDELVSRYFPHKVY